MQASALTNNTRLPLTLPAWLISDTHFYHRRLAEEYEFEARSVLGDDHEAEMIERWASTVADNDPLIHFGDVALGQREEFEAIADLLPGEKFLILGNHDRRSRQWYRERGFSVVPEFRFSYRNYTIICSHYPDDAHQWIRYPRTLNIHGHVHSQTRLDRHLINISAEAIDFRPVWSNDLLDGRITELESGENSA
jgi:calcineurin-like phosphoesterase family protein